MNRKGVTLVEALFCCGIAAWLGISAANYFRLPTYLNSLMNTTTNQATGYGATAAPIDDLKCALSSSIQWSKIDQSTPTYSPATYSQIIPWFQINDPTVAAALPISYVCYKYRSSDGALLREFISGAAPTGSPITLCNPVTADHAQERVIVKGLLPPTAAAPLFSKDQAATNMVVLMLRVRDSNNAVMTIVRRVHIRS